MTYHLPRRAFLSAMGAGLVLPRTAFAVPTSSMRIASLDYGLASTLLALGVTPVGVAAAEDWDKWVIEPPLPDSVVDLGTDREVNLEVLAALEPDLVLATPYVQAVVPLVEAIAPILTFTIYAEGGEPLDRAEAATRELGTHIGRAEEAEAFLKQANAHFRDCARRLAQYGPREVLLISFMDARHARVYGRHGLFQSTLDRIGLENAWRQETNYWGFQTIGLEELAAASGPDTHIVAFEPVPADVRPTLANSPLWNRLPPVAAGRFAVLPGVLMFGMVPAAIHFADLITGHFERLAA